MKFNWGYKLLVTYVAFVGLMGYLVYRCVTTNFDLVTPEYYKDELAYQQVINGTVNANALSSPVAVVTGGQYITIRLPKEMHNQKVKGMAWFYCPSDARRDKKIPLKMDSDAVQEIPLREILPGHYTVKIAWDSNNAHYYTEQHITL